MPPTKYDRSLLLFGPYDETLVHQPNDGYLEQLHALSTSKDVLIEAIFTNPYDNLSDDWAHGFMFKGGESNYFYSVVLEREQEWERFGKMGSGNYIGTLDTPTVNINNAPGEKNLLQVILAHGQAWVYINGIFEGSFPADLDTGGDEISFYVDDDHEGNTLIEDATIWQWHPSLYRDFPEVNPNYVPPATPMPTITPTPNPKVPVFGPVSGRIQHDEGDGRYEFSDGPNINGDVMVEFTFEVPFTPRESHWNFGLWFDSSKSGAYHIVEINSLFGGSYNHWRKSGSGESRQGRRSEDVIGINFQKGEKNHVRVILIDDEAWLYVNDRRMGILNFGLGNIPAPEWVGLVIADFDGQGFRYSRGGHTKFEDFTVWRWHPSLFDLPKDD